MPASVNFSRRVAEAIALSEENVFLRQRVAWLKEEVRALKEVLEQKATGVETANSKQGEDA